MPRSGASDPGKGSTIANPAFIFLNQEDDVEDDDEIDVDVIKAKLLPHPFKIIQV